MPVRVLRGLHRVVSRVRHAIEPQVQFSADAGQAEAEVFRRGYTPTGDGAFTGSNPELRSNTRSASQVPVTYAASVRRSESISARAALRVAMSIFPPSRASWTAVSSAFMAGRDHPQRRRRCRVLSV